MNVRPIANPLAGEQIVAVDPPLTPRVDAGWRRRLNLFTGRSLDASALAAEQRSRATRAALLARALTPGIVTGLETGLTGTAFNNAVLDLAPGLGLTAWGEDVRLARALQVRLDLLQVAGEDGSPTLRELIARGSPIPAALILVLQPVLVEEIGAADPFASCERDPQSEAFEDQRIVDACRPLLVPWPADLLDLPDPGPRWRNRLAWTIFEEAREASGLLPWEELGVPLALVGSDEFAGSLFLDRSSVARIGGWPRTRSVLLPKAGGPTLWQARIQQLVEHLSDLLAAENTTVAGIAAQFELLPPAGLLPREAAVFAPPLLGAADQDGGDQSFFPSGFRVGAVPIPIDELEPLFEASASLAPLDSGEPEEVQLLVPVPGSLYDPDLLVRERVAPEIEAALARALRARDLWLFRRGDVREKFNTLLKSLQGSGALLPYSDVDPDAQSGEVPQLFPGEPQEEDFGTFPGATDTKVLVLRTLKRSFRRRKGEFSPLKAEWNRRILQRYGLNGIIWSLASRTSPTAADSLLQQQMKAALEACRQAAGTVEAYLRAARRRLANIDSELAEARHDVTVILILLTEEKKRVKSINEHRLEVLANHIPFLAYHRPRVVETLADGPVRPLDPPLAEDPIPTALARPADPPAELREMVELLRDAPLRWFRHLPPLLDRLDRLDILQSTLRLARGRAEAFLARPFRQVETLALVSPAAQGASRTLVAQRQTQVQVRTEVARLDLAAMERLSWQGAADLARNVLSLGDLLDIPHGRADVIRQAARELDQILRVATALWVGFGEVLPALRLDWVERFSQFDTPVVLNRLANLPRWEEIEVEDRRTLQALVDWLFQRIDPKVPEAVSFLNDLVRVCVLLASHAPVDRIVAGRVAEDTPLRPGVIVPLAVEVSRVRIGMPVLLYAQETVAARAVVEDLGGGRAFARVLDAAMERVGVDARAEFTEAPVLTGLTSRTS